MKSLSRVRLLRPWDFPGKSAGVACHFLLQGIFLTQETNSGLPHCQADALPSEPPPDYSKNNQVARINSNPFQRDHTKTTKILENKKEIPNRAWWVTAMTVGKKKLVFPLKKKYSQRRQISPSAGVPSSCWDLGCTAEGEPRGSEQGKLHLLLPTALHCSLYSLKHCLR